MYCAKCGKQIDDTSNFCNSCGHPVDQRAVVSGPTNPAYKQVGDMSERKQQPNNDHLKKSPISEPTNDPARGRDNRAKDFVPVPDLYGPPVVYPPIEPDNPVREDPIGPVPEKSSSFDDKINRATAMGFGMKYYKFIVYIQIMLGCIVGIGSAISSFLGLQYGSLARELYFMYPAMKVLDVMNGLFSLALCALMAYIWYGLRKFNFTAVTLYIFVPLVSLVLNIIYAVIASVILKTSLLNSPTTIGGAIGLLIGSVGMFIINYIYFSKRRVLFTN